MSSLDDVRGCCEDGRCDGIADNLHFTGSLSDDFSGSVMRRDERQAIHLSSNNSVQYSDAKLPRYVFY